MIISERQKAAARLNGAKSRGPKTEVGKRRSSRNGCKHNLYSRSFLAPGESTDGFVRLLEEFRAIYQPRTPRTENALHILAANTWLQNRARATEISLMNAAMDRLAPLHLGADFHTLAFLACERLPIDLMARTEGRYQRRIDRAEDILLKEWMKAQVPTPPQAPAKSLKTRLRTRESFVCNTQTAQSPEPKTAAAESEALPILHPNVFEPAATPEPPTAAPQAPSTSSKTKSRTRQPFIFNAETARNPEPKPCRTTAFTRRSSCSALRTEAPSGGASAAALPRRLYMRRRPGP